MNENWSKILIFPPKKSCVPGVRRSVGTLSTAIEFMGKTSTSFRLIRWALRRQHVDTFPLNLSWNVPKPDWVSICSILNGTSLCPSSSGTNTLSWGVCGILLHVEEVWTSWVLYPAGHKAQPQKVQPAIREHVSTGENANGKIDVEREITPEPKYTYSNNKKFTLAWVILLLFAC